MKGKRLFAFVVAVMLSLTMGIVGVAAEDNNLLVNGNFDSTNLSYWWMRADWNGGTWEYAPTGGNGGTGGLTVNGTGAGTSDQNAGLFYTASEGTESYLTLVEGELYKLSFMVNRPDGVNSNVYMDVNEGALGKGSATGHGWEKVEFTFTANSAPIKLRLVVNALGEGKTVSVDEISLVSVNGAQLPEGEAAAGNALNTDKDATLGDNLVKNGDFTSAFTTNWWFRTDWNGGIWERIEDSGVDGSPCLRATGDGEGGPANNAGAFLSETEGQETFLVLNEGETYQVDAMVFVPEGVNARVYLDINEGLGSGAADKTGEWCPISFRFVAPADAIKFRIVANALPTGETVFVDDVQLRQVGAVPTESSEESSESSVHEGPTIAPAPSVEAGGMNTLTIVLICVGAALLIAAAAVVILMLRKKKTKTENKTEK